jgi:hypothetical protein
VTPDTLVLQFGPSAAVSIPRVAGQRIYVRTGSSRIRSALHSALLYGVASGIIVAQTDASHRSRVLTTGGIVLGGFAFGALSPMERWQRVAP